MVHSTTPSASQALSAANKKRRRDSPIDWKDFYGDQQPKEIIVIDDTPEFDSATVPIISTSQKKQINSSTAKTTETYAYRDISTTRHDPKRRKQDSGIPTRCNPVHHNRLNRSTTTQQQNSISSNSTNSYSSRTDSPIHTTTATSLGFLSSNGQYDYDGKKTKRTRQQVANEVKHRDNAIISHNFSSYQPPSHPLKVAREIHIREVPDSYNGEDIDDDDDHYIVAPDAPLTNNYQIIKLLGQGTFGKVVQARDQRSDKLVAIKIIRSSQKYRDASRTELRVLASLKANDPENRNRCIHLRDCFDYQGHICIVMDLLGQSLFDFLKSNSFVPFPNSQIQSFAYQLFTSIAYLHDLDIIHTDLKPENILLYDSAYQLFTYNKKIPISSRMAKRKATQRRVLFNPEIHLIDFGCATFRDEAHSSVVSTRYYRAPEILLGLGWSFPCDIWSIGCILVELFTGDPLFESHENLEHLAMMERIVGTPIDSHLVTRINKMGKSSGGNPASKYFKRGKLDYPQQITTARSQCSVKATKKLDDIVPNNKFFLSHFKDLLKKIFTYDPRNRITAKQALQHPWFQETAPFDDGTEAARIKIKRMHLPIPWTPFATIPTYHSVFSSPTQLDEDEKDFLQTAQSCRRRNMSMKLRTGAVQSTAAPTKQIVQGARYKSLRRDKMDERKITERNAPLFIEGGFKSQLSSPAIQPLLAFDTMGQDVPDFAFSLPASTLNNDNPEAVSLGELEKMIDGYWKRGGDDPPEQNKKGLGAHDNLSGCCNYTRTSREQSLDKA